MRFAKMQNARAATTITVKSATVQATRSGVMQTSNMPEPRLLLIVRPIVRSVTPQARHGRRQTRKKFKRGASGIELKNPHTCRTSASGIAQVRQTGRPHGLRRTTWFKYGAGINLPPCTTGKAWIAGMLITSSPCMGKKFQGFMSQAICESSERMKTRERQTSMLSNNLKTELAALKGAQA